MHTKANTDVEIIRRNCEARSAAANDNNCVLITTGALNPIHRSHIRNLLLVKTYLEKHPTRPLTVLAAYLSPTHDSYVCHKLGASHWIAGEKRAELCRQSIEAAGQNEFISVAKGEFRHEHFADFDEVTIDLAKFLNEELHNSTRLLSHPLKVIYICGLDHFNKCPYVARLAAMENIGCAVVYRLGASDSHIKHLQQRSPSGVYYIPLDDERADLVDISSTEIRRQFQQPTDSSARNDMVYSCVAEYMQDKYKHTN